MSQDILVTGAAGFVGQHLVETLVRKGHRVTAVDIRHDPDLAYDEHLGDNAEYLRGSILNRDFVDNVVFPTPHAYDKVFHLAAVVGVDRYVDIDDPLHIVNVNINGTRRILDRIRGTETDFVYTSTSEVYGRNPDIPWKEGADRVLGPTTVSRWSYSSTKNVCEHMIHILAENDELNASVVRPFNLYGPYQRPSFVIPKFIQMALDGEPPTVYGDGTQKRCFTFIGDFIDGIIAASERSQTVPRTFNLGGTREIEIQELAEVIVDAVGLDAEPVYTEPEAELNGDYDQPDRRIPDIERAREHLDWEPTTLLSEGVEQTVESMRSN
ncbi:GDP-mannose 4,6-dehydratase [Halomicrobium sp. IBSBa]|uniref:NAD-dependent epimerase/dehydratase family protein n=1 Tax=Halomicrobium sp. IBSBa TaxID=2778916 RepID=UPI001ABF37CB|nr:NAD-dependent epimerase/dehydratase family protein [Halomicrobium sp. IBSBa]MBO4249544.1 GDP-mannose 4,6-dehydratase [Halomicrobium sp. IBSBa]